MSEDTKLLKDDFLKWVQALPPELADQPYPEENTTSRITGRALPTLRNDRHNRRGIPYHKIGRSVRYSLRDIFQYMEKRKIETSG